MRRLPVPMARAAAGVVACLALTAACVSDAPEEDGGDAKAERVAAVPGFSFAAAGDLGANSLTSKSLAALDAAPVDFFLALGDLDYDQTSSDQAWCDYVTNRLPMKGSGFPFELVVGNHEDDDGPDGRITNFTGCLPDQLVSQIGPDSVYGAEYSFAYPAKDPLAKVIMISPGLTVSGEEHTYGARSPHRRWLAGQVHQAREDGIRWVIVGMHLPCITTGIRHGCDSGSGILNLLLRKRVDLVLGGHNHLYERSKQLRLNGRDCVRVRPGGYNANCVVDAGGDDSYVKGRGAVLVTAGSFGRLEPAETVEDPERRYFAQSDATTAGFAEFRVTADRIAATFTRTEGTMDDSFEITAPR